MLRGPQQATTLAAANLLCSWHTCRLSVFLNSPLFNSLPDDLKAVFTGLKSSLSLMVNGVLDPALCIAVNPCSPDVDVLMGKCQCCATEHARCVTCTTHCMSWARACWQSAAGRAMRAASECCAPVSLALIEGDGTAGALAQHEAGLPRVQPCPCAASRLWARSPPCRPRRIPLHTRHHHHHMQA